MYTQGGGESADKHLNKAIDQSHFLIRVRAANTIHLLTPIEAAKGMLV